MKAHGSGIGVIEAHESSPKLRELSYAQAFLAVKDRFYSCPVALQSCPDSSFLPGRVCRLLSSGKISGALLRLFLCRRQHCNASRSLSSTGRGGCVSSLV